LTLLLLPRQILECSGSSREQASFLYAEQARHATSNRHRYWKSL